ncbi:MAG: PD40 domain-containing protein [Phaeodactylibacter sp.]|nr:PD40 domain-containing protein [Phaeodactylibacter sp.]
MKVLKHALIVALVLVWMGCTLRAQPPAGLSELKNKHQKLFKEAGALTAAGEWEPACRLVAEILRVEPGFAEGWLLQAHIQEKKDSLGAAEKSLEQALALQPGLAPRVLSQLGRLEFAQQKYQEALEHLEQAGDESLLLASARFAVLATAQPAPFDPQPLGPAINTADPEYLPFLTADGKMLAFTRRVGQQQEDVFWSQQVEGRWQEALPLREVNSLYNEAAPYISPDGQYLALTICGRPDGQGRCDLYFSRKEKGEWLPPQNPGAPLNSSSWDAQPSLSPDGQRLFFASRRPGGLGGTDIWMAQRLPDGQWGEPQNLGPVVNTPENEQSPFLHFDGQSLFFMSNGHPGMGGFDLFRSRLRPDGSWEQPLNLGYPINTHADEGGLFVSLDGKTAFYARASAGRQEDTDLFSFGMYPEIRSQPLSYVEGKIQDASTRNPLPARVEIVGLTTGDTLYYGNADGQGHFWACLPAGEDYALTVSEKDHLFYSDNLPLANTGEPGGPFFLNIGLQPILLPIQDSLLDEPVVLHNIFFEFGSAALLPESFRELRQLKRFLAENPGLRIRINGHTDSVGSDEDNQLLSESRAKAVYYYLVAEGIELERLSYAGFGESRPVAPNDTEAARQKNRRTEFELIRE